MKRVRVALVDDHGIVRRGLAAIIADAPDLTLVGEAVDGFQALTLLNATEIDVLILDLNLPRISGEEVLTRIKRDFPSVHVLILTLQSEDFLAARLIQRGATGYLSKDRSPEDVLAAIRSVARGERVLPSDLARSADAERVTAPHESLSAREYQVFMLLLQGRTVSEIAAELDLTVSTVSTHLGHVRTKLGVKTIAEIVTYAHRAGLAG